MANVMLHGLPLPLHRALKSRAALNSRTVEAEILAILDQVLKPRATVGMGTDFASLIRELSGPKDRAAPPPRPDED